MGYLTSDTLWDLRELPKRLVVLGGGPIGCELTQAFARLGSRVTQVEMLPRIMVREDQEVSEIVKTRFEADGVRVLTGHTAKRFIVEHDEKALIAEHRGKDVRIPFDAVLVAVGRVANTQGYGLEALGIRASKTRTVETDDYLFVLGTDGAYTVTLKRAVDHGAPDSATDDELVLDQITYTVTDGNNNFAFGTFVLVQWNAVALTRRHATDRFLRGHGFVSWQFDATVKTPDIVIAF